MDVLLDLLSPVEAQSGQFGCVFYGAPLATLEDIAFGTASSAALFVLLAAVAFGFFRFHGRRHPTTGSYG